MSTQDPQKQQTYRFVWRRASGKHQRWITKTVMAVSPEEALTLLDAHLAKLGNDAPIIVDHLFYQVGAEGMRGDDVVMLETLPEFESATRKLVTVPAGVNLTWAKTC